jgi:cyclophilin family peptidyl-prolyl cis-trans isomerase
MIHRVVKGFIIQGGDFVFGNGSGGESIYNGKKFKDERLGLGLKHDRAGILSMGNSGKNSNTSQFFVTLDKAPQCDGKHVVFGEVVSGMEVITALEQHATPAGGEPTVPIKITDCGAFIPLITPGAGYWYDRPDSESYSGFTPEFMARPRIGILAPSKQVAERFRIALGEHASTLLVAVDDVGGDDEQIIPRLMEQLENFALDLVMAAPACSQLLKQMDLPASWSDATKNFNGDSVLPKREQVFIEAKPADAIAAVLNETWVANMRHSWMLSASFRTV